MLILVQLSESQKYGALFGGIIITIGLVISTVVLPFWNFIREDVFEEVEILLNDNGRCYVNTSDEIPKTIDECTAQIGDKVTIKFGQGLPRAEIVNP